MVGPGNEVGHGLAWNAGLGTGLLLLAQFPSLYLDLMLVVIQSPFESTSSFFSKQFIYSSNFSNSYKTNKTILKS